MVEPVDCPTAPVGRVPSGWLRRAAATMLHEPPPLAAITRRPCHPWLVVGLVSVGAFIGQLDATIVQLALPAMKTAFGVHTSTVSWVSLAYLLAFASFLPVFGRLCQMFGRKSLYLAGYALFTVATVLCGAATGIVPLIIFRVLQGIGGSLLGANSIAILISAMKGPQRGRALGYFAAAQAIGMSAGPAVGGLLLTSLGWQWVFWATVPFGIAAFAAGWLVLLRTGETDSKATFDWRGALLIGPALTALVLGLNQAAVWGIAAPATLGCLALSIALMVLLVWQERRISAPLVDLRLFASPAFTLGGLAVMLGYALLYGMFFLMSFVLVHGFHEGPLGAGLRMAVIPVALGITAALSGGAGGRFGPKTLSVAGMTSCVVGLAMLEVALRDATLPVGRLRWPSPCSGSVSGSSSPPTTTKPCGRRPLRFPGRRARC